MFFDDALSSVSPRGLAFTVSNGQVTAMQEVLGTRTLDLRIPTGATFAVGASTITETLAGDHGTTVLTFAPEAANASLYSLVSETWTAAAPTTTPATGITAGYLFTIGGGVVTAMQSSVTGPQGTYTSPAALPADAVFTVATGGVTETRVEGHAVETIHFVQPSGSTLYAVASETTTLVSAGSATTLLAVDPHDRLAFTFASNGSVSAAEAVGRDGTLTPLTPDSHTTYTPLAPGYVEAVHTFGSHVEYEVFFAGSGSGGVYTEVAHGSGQAVDLVGLQAQLAQLPTAVDAII